MSGFRALVVHGQPEALGELVEILSDHSCLWIRPGARLRHCTGFSAGIMPVIVSESQATRAERPGSARTHGGLLSRRDAYRDGGRPRGHVPGGAEAAGTIFRFFAKPWERRQLTGIVAEGLKLHRLEREQRELIKKLGASTRS
jgi:hypothetical protein